MKAEEGLMAGFIPKNSKGYLTVIREDFLVWYRGAIVLVDNGAYKTDISEIVSLFFQDKLDFNMLFGSYRVVALHNQTGNLYFWGDNSGSQVFYIDRNEGLYSDSFLSLLHERKGDLLPNFDSIAQLLKHGLVYSYEMLVKGIVQSNPNKYYKFDSVGIAELDKRLNKFSEVKEPLDMSKLTEALLTATGKEKVAAVITGGTDSRAVLAHLLKAGCIPELYITGHKDSKDVQIAFIISHKLGLELHVIDPVIKEDGWILKAFEASDGVYDIFGRDRLLKLLEYQKERNLIYEFGGVAGELYKNSFIWAFFPRCNSGKPSVKLFVERYFRKTLLPESLCGENLLLPYQNTKKSLEILMSEYMDAGKFRTYNQIGYFILQRRFVKLTNSSSEWIVPIHPLMERDLAAGVSNCNPHRLWMHRWQRKQIALACPVLSDIGTDQGHTCSNSFWKCLLELISEFNKRVKYVIRIKVLKKSRKASQWDSDFLDGVNTPQYKQAVKSCKELGILDESIDEGQIPVSISGQIALIGMVFSSKKSKLTSQEANL